MSGAPGDLATMLQRAPHRAAAGSLLGPEGQSVINAMNLSIRTVTKQTKKAN